MPMISPGCAVRVSPAKNRLVGVGEGEVFQRHGGGAGTSSGASCSGNFISGFDAPPGNFGFWTELKSFATFDDLTTSFVKQDKNVVNAAIFQAHQPAQDVLRAEPQDKQHARLGHSQVERRQRRLPDIAAQRSARSFSAHPRTVPRGQSHSRSCGRSRRSGHDPAWRRAKRPPPFVGRPFALHRLFIPAAQT